MSALPDPGLIARFRGDVEAALGREIDQRDVIALAVSGGPDSMAMLALATAAFPGQVIAATVDHGLRSASGGEAAMVADYCAQLGVAHATLSIADPRDPRDNLHDWARGQRYALLKRWAVDQGARVLATAHHADDQAETFLMRAARGSGVAGLAGIRQLQQLDTTPPLDLLRPLLQWRAIELRGIAAAGGIPFVDDPSNVDDRFDRTGFRALLRETSLLDAAQLARSAAHVAEVDGALRAIELWLGKSRQVVPTGVDDPDDQLWIDMADLPRELRRRLVRSAIHSVRTIHDITRPDFSDATNIESLLDALQAGKPATQAGVLVSPKRTIWRFSLAPPRRSL